MMEKLLNISGILLRTEKGETIEHVFSEGGLKHFTLTVSDNDNLNNSTTTIQGSINVNHHIYHYKQYGTIKFFKCTS